MTTSSIRTTRSPSVYAPSILLAVPWAFASPRTIRNGSLDASERRFALAETLAHLERLVLESRAARTGNDDHVSYTAA